MLGGNKLDLDAAIGNLGTRRRLQVVDFVQAAVHVAIEQDEVLGRPAEQHGGRRASWADGYRRARVRERVARGTHARESLRRFWRRRRGAARRRGPRRNGFAQTWCERRDGKGDAETRRREGGCEFVGGCFTSWRSSPSRESGGAKEMEARSLSLYKRDNFSRSTCAHGRGRLHRRLRAEEGGGGWTRQGGVRTDGGREQEFSGTSGAAPGSFRRGTRVGDCTERAAPTARGLPSERSAPQSPLQCLQPLQPRQPLQHASGRASRTGPDIWKRVHPLRRRRAAVTRRTAGHFSAASSLCRPLLRSLHHCPPLHRHRITARRCPWASATPTPSPNLPPLCNSITQPVCPPPHSLCATALLAPSVTHRLLQLRTPHPSQSRPVPAAARPHTHCLQ